MDQPDGGQGIGMYHVFAAKEQYDGAVRTLTLSGEDYHHIVRVLRMKKGEEFSVSFPADDGDYRFGIEAITASQVHAVLRFVKKQTAELPVHVVLFQGLPKADKMEQIIEKTTELGVKDIYPVVMKRCVMRPDPQKVKAKVTRWQKKAEAAAAQSRRGMIPVVHMPVSFEEMLRIAAGADVRIMPYECAAEEGARMQEMRALISAIRPGQEVAVCIGPEGGFDLSEVAAARAAHFQTVTLGGRILRTETAPVAVMSWLSFSLEP